MNETSRIISCDFETRNGKMRLSATLKGLFALDFPVPESRPLLSGEIPPELREATEVLKLFFAGKRVSFRDLAIDWSGYTPFECRVLQILFRSRRDKVWTYGELAGRAGAPGGARAVGRVMKKNRLPIIIPCHRVLAMSGLGGYSRGISWKKELLRLECPAGKGIPALEGRIRVI